MRLTGRISIPKARLKETALFLKLGFRNNPFAQSKNRVFARKFAWFDTEICRRYNSFMKITKCDICKKELNSHHEIVRISLIMSDFNSFEVCFECGKPVVKMLGNKKLIDKSEIKKKYEK